MRIPAEQILGGHDNHWIAWVFLGAVIAYFGFWIFAHFYKGRVREIIVVKKRTTVRQFRRFLSLKHTSSGFYDYTAESVDFRYIGKKMLHIKFCNSEEIYKKLSVGKTYKVRIKFSWIDKIYPK